MSSSPDASLDPVRELIRTGINWAIFRDCTDDEWHNRKHVLIPFPQTGVDLFTTQFPIRHTEEGPSTLGVLERLSLEIKTMMVNRMDLATVVRFMHTNRDARALVQQVPEFRLVTQYAGDSGFLAALVTRLSSFVTLPQIQDALTAKECATCPNFAELVFLPTMERCCGYCLRQNDKFTVRTVFLKSRPSGVSPRIPVLTGRPAYLVQQAATNIANQVPKMCAMRGGGPDWETNLIRIFPSSMQDSILGPIPLDDDEHLAEGEELSEEEEDEEEQEEDFTCSWTVCRFPLIENPWGLRERGEYDDAADIEPGLLATIPVPYLKDRRTGEFTREGVTCAARG